MNGWTWFAFGAIRWLGPLLVAIGGAIGAVARYAMSSVITAHRATLKPGRRSFLPWGTMMVNIVGSFIIGLLATIIPSLVWPRLFYPIAASDAWINLLTLFFVTGICGGFTTFSTATVEALSLARTGHLAVAIRSVLITLILALSAVVTGGLVGTGFTTHSVSP